MNASSSVGSEMKKTTITLPFVETDSVFRNSGLIFTSISKEKNIIK